MHLRKSKFRKNIFALSLPLLILRVDRINLPAPPPSNIRVDRINLPALSPSPIFIPVKGYTQLDQIKNGWLLAIDFNFCDTCIWQTVVVHCCKTKSESSGKDAPWIISVTRSLASSYKMSPSAKCFRPKLCTWCSYVSDGRWYTVCHYFCILFNFVYFIVNKLGH